MIDLKKLENARNNVSRAFKSLNGSISPNYNKQLLDLSNANDALGVVIEQVKNEKEQSYEAIAERLAVTLKRARMFTERGVELPERIDDDLPAYEKLKEGE